MCTSVAGCTSFGDSRTTTGQSARVTIVLENPSDTEQRYEIEVVWGEGNRSQFSGVLQPAASDVEMLATTGTAPESATFFVGAANSGQSGTWNPTDCPDYRVDAVIENGNPSFETTCQV
ncbi:hypothetical protein AUR64_13520 [Haloprofundus marisrubri]|uniref:Uncharacterized protein n=1 Tax=Haloprofundus marisrubri TaxID=1514971 RepID=A0A0W1R6H4_9EURY|nr:hypothetical protein AUR64_13520 [Haloprofundus marisrubri]